MRSTNIIDRYAICVIKDGEVVGIDQEKCCNCVLCSFIEVDPLFVSKLEVIVDIK